jgi:lipoate-protein ligase A
VRNRHHLFAMLLINNNGTTDPAVNLALEEHCFRNLDPDSEYLLFYINRPSIIIGRHQNPFQEINQDLARRKVIFPVRRISGGGAVYHDFGNLNFSFITDFTEKKLGYFKTLLAPILNTLQQLGAPAELTEKNNILVNGKKISGNSQHTNMRRMLSHGTLLFDSDLEVLRRVLKTDLMITKSRAVASIPGNVTNICGNLSRPMDMAAFRAAVQKGISGVFGEMKEQRLTSEDWEAVDRLANIKYKSWDWTFGRTPEFAVRHRIRLESGYLDACFNIKHGVIRNVEPEDKLPQTSSDRRIITRMIGKQYDVKYLMDFCLADKRVK